MPLNRLLEDPEVVVVSRTAVPPAPGRADFVRAAAQVLGAIGLRAESAVIKPNLTTAVQRAKPDDGIVTHVDFVRGMVEYLHAHGAARDRITILEDPLDEDHDGPRDWAKTGFHDIADALGARLAFPTLPTVVERKVPRPLVFASRRVAEQAVEPGSFLINVPKLKTHTWAITTLCMKNLMGLDYQVDRHYCSQSIQSVSGLEGRDFARKAEWLDTATHERIQENLAKRLADLAQVVRPRLNVVEGVVGRDGTGFHRGANYGLGLAIAGVNVVAVDAVASYIMGFDPAKLIYLTIAAGVGLGTNDLAKIRVFTVEDGRLEACRDLDSLRVDPPFRVITECTDEDENRYR